MNVPEEWLPDPARGEQNPAYRLSGPQYAAAAPLLMFGVHPELLTGRTDPPIDRPKIAA